MAAAEYVNRMAGLVGNLSVDEQFGTLDGTFTAVTSVDGILNVGVIGVE